MLKKSLNSRKLKKYVIKQINNLFPDDENIETEIYNIMPIVLKRVEYCFSKVNNKYFNKNKTTYFDHLNSDQYAMFLYFLANTLWVEYKNTSISSRVYYLNKALHGLDIYFEVMLPNIFLLVHPVGTVLGRGIYKDYFVSYQRVTVGGNISLVYPQFGEGIVMYGDSVVIGSSVVSNNCYFSVGSIVINTKIPDNSIVFGRHPKNVLKKTTHTVKEKYFI